MEDVVARNQSMPQRKIYRCIIFGFFIVSISRLSITDTVSTMDDVYFTAPVRYRAKLIYGLIFRNDRDAAAQRCNDIDPFDRAGAARLAAWIGIVIEGRQTGADQPVVRFLKGPCVEKLFHHFYLAYCKLILFNRISLRNNESKIRINEK